MNRVIMVAARKTPVLLVYESFAQFEVAPAAFVLSMTGNRPIVVGQTMEPVTSAEGFSVRPDIRISEVDLNQVSVLIVPGGNISRLSDTHRLNRLILTADEKGMPLAAICGGPGVFGRAGILANHKYTTSLDINAYEYLPTETYVENDVVIDRNLITAKPYANVDFAIAIADMLGLDRVSPEYRMAVSSLRRSG